MTDKLDNLRFEKLKLLNQRKKLCKKIKRVNMMIAKEKYEIEKSVLTKGA